MKIITSQFVFKVLSDINYSVDENGSFQIVLKIEPDEIDWRKILRSDKAPIIAFHHYLDEIRVDRHKIWVANLAYKTINSYFENEKNRDELIEQFAVLAMKISEAVIIPDNIFQVYLSRHRILILRLHYIYYITHLMYCQ